MAKIYCLSCNCSTSYDSSRPKFCASCGKPFIDSVAASRLQPDKSSVFTPTVHRPILESRGRLNRQIDEEYPEDATEVPQLNSIQYNISVSNLRPNRESGKDVFTSGSADEAKETLTRALLRKKNKITKSGQNKIKNSFKDDFKNQLSTKGGSQRDSSEITG